MKEEYNNIKAYEKFIIKLQEHERDIFMLTELEKEQEK